MSDDAVRGFCPTCNSDVPGWKPGPGGRPNAACPTCGSLERHRHLALLLNTLKPTLANSRYLLEAAPQPQMRAFLSIIAPHLIHVRTDLMDLRWIDVAADGVALPFRDEMFDLVLHFHVFEHIPDDRAAMKEVARVLRANGLMLCQVPRRTGQLTDEEGGLTPEQRRVRYGQNDHVRMYGDDFESRLVECGFAVQGREAGDMLTEAELSRFNIPPTDHIWLCFPLKDEGSMSTVHLNRDIDLLNYKLATALDDYAKLRSRKVVRLGLAIAKMAKPFVRASRHFRSRLVRGARTRPH